MWCSAHRIKGVAAVVLLSRARVDLRFRAAAQSSDKADPFCCRCTTGQGIKASLWFGLLGWRTPNGSKRPHSPPGKAFVGEEPPPSWRRPRNSSSKVLPSSLARQDSYTRSTLQWCIQKIGCAAKPHVSHEQTVRRSAACAQHVRHHGAPHAKHGGKCDTSARGDGTRGERNGRT